MKLPLPRTVLWDMDGTLIDQSEPIVRCYTQVITAMGYPQPTPDEIRRSMGGPMVSTMSLFVENERMEEACTAFRALFPEIMFDGMVVLPGAKELIEFFAEESIPQAIFTNKHGPTAREVSKHCGFDTHIQVCIGNADTEWSKPDSRLTDFVMQQLGSSAEECILIGDSPTDVQTAKNGGVDCYAVSTGAHTVEELTTAGANAAFENLDQLRDKFVGP